MTAPTHFVLLGPGATGGLVLPAQTPAQRALVARVLAAAAVAPTEVLTGTPGAPEATGDWVHPDPVEGRALTRAALELAEGRLAEAARLAGVPRRTLQRWISDWGLAGVAANLRAAFGHPDPYHGRP